MYTRVYTDGFVLIINHKKENIIHIFKGVGLHEWYNTITGGVVKNCEILRKRNWGGEKMDGD